MQHLSCQEQSADHCFTSTTEDGHKSQSQVTESTRDVGSQKCARKESGSLRGRSQCPSMCHMSTLLLGHTSNPATYFTPSNSPCRFRRGNRSNFILHVAVSPPVSPCRKADSRMFHFVGRTHESLLERNIGVTSSSDLDVPGYMIWV